MIPAERAHLLVAALSHPGISGKNNEDRYAVSAFRLEEENPVPVVFAIVSDGIGGHRAGEVAAEMVVETVSQAVAKSDGRNPIQTLREAIMRSSQEILVQAESDTEKKGMGATCACALIIGDRLYIAYVGDSRIYLLRGGAIQQISIDHTWVQEAIEAKIIEPEQGKVHPNAHVIRRYLGSKQAVEPDTRLRLSPDESPSESESNQGLSLLPDDQILVCSDGLTDLVSDEEILSALREQEFEPALEELVKLANQRGGHDNITLVALRTLTRLADTVKITPPPAQKKRALWLIPVVVIALLFILAALGAGIYLIYQRSITPSVTSAPVESPVVSQPALLPTLETEPVEIPAGTPQAPTPLSTPGALGTPADLTPVFTYTPWPTNTRSP